MAQRLCHVIFDNLVEISKKKKVRGLPRLKKPENVMCKECQLGKMTKSSFKRKSFTPENILDLVHTDLFGPMGVQSYCGARYFILFVDDHTRMMCVNVKIDEYAERNEADSKRELEDYRSFV